jgi:hypothetical protein
MHRSRSIELIALHHGLTALRTLQFKSRNQGTIFVIWQNLTRPGWSRKAAHAQTPDEIRMPASGFRVEQPGFRTVEMALEPLLVLKWGTAYLDHGEGQR